MTTEQLAKIQWLNRAFHAEKNYKAWLAKLERDQSIAERLTRSRDGTGSPSGNFYRNFPDSVRHRDNARWNAVTGASSESVKKLQLSFKQSLIWMLKPSLSGTIWHMRHLSR